MKPAPDVYKLNDHILKIKALLIELEAMAPDFPALSRNSKRALATIKMMELNLSDVITTDLADL
ncbi:MAG: hypothetical protein A3J85_03710 [Desulfobacula sp. RIFOXYA12_FULL_46_16]|nr:MAG: hypothetical protein A3J85_03710 [Desulfobacula sp. RIFOXYA12_FULL_46_16]